MKQYKDNYAKAVAESLIEFCNLKKKVAPAPQTSPVSDATEKISVIYQVHDYKKNKMLPEVKDNTDYAGNFGNPIDAVRAYLTKGNIYYKVHIKATKTRKGRWLPEVKNNTDYAGNLGQLIDAVAFRTDTGRIIKYAVHEKVSGRWLPPVTGCNINDNKNGYAGNFGREIDAVKIWIE